MGAAIKQFGRWIDPTVNPISAGLLAFPTGGATALLYGGKKLYGALTEQKQVDDPARPPPAPDLTDQTLQKAALLESRRLAKQRGRQGTFLSGPTEPPSLLGGGS